MNARQRYSQLRGTVASMRHRRRKAYQVPGAAPGSWQVSPEAPATKLRLTSYTKESCETHDHVTVETAKEIASRHNVTWLRVQGLGSTHTLREIAASFSISSLTMEDVVQTDQRPKVEIIQNGVLLVLKLPRLGSPTETEGTEGGNANSRIETSSTSFWLEQVSILAIEGTVLTFEESSGGYFDSIHARIENPEAPMRSRSSDYLAYALLDAVIDHHFPVASALAYTAEPLEELVLSGRGRSVLPSLLKLKRDTARFRSAVRPLQEIAHILLGLQSSLIREETRAYLRDCKDHTLELVDKFENLRDQGQALLDIHLNLSNHQMGETMRLLTVLTMIFLPLSLIAGIYGMNFRPEDSPLNMPELHWYWGYPFALGLMATVALISVIFFARKGWLSRGP